MRRPGGPNERLLEVLLTSTIAGANSRTTYVGDAQPRSFSAAAFVAATPTVVTVILELAGRWYPSNSVRALAGLPLGVVVGLVVTSALATLHYDECVPRRRIVSKPPQRSI